jgi:hypothetical protein
LPRTSTPTPTLTPGDFWLLQSQTDRADLKDAKRLHVMVTQVCSMLTGLALGQRMSSTACGLGNLPRQFSKWAWRSGAGYALGVSLIETKDFQKFDDWFKAVFEVARRHKIMNPGKLG